MFRTRSRPLVGLVAAMWFGVALGQSEEQMRRLKELDQKCAKAREAKLRVIQQQKIEACVKEPPEHRAAPKSRADCERYWGDYGWGMGTWVGRTDRLYEDIPECVAAFRAWESQSR